MEFERNKDPLDIIDSWREKADFRAMDALIHFLHNFSSDFIEEIWGKNTRLSKHFTEKLIIFAHQQKTQIITSRVFLNFIRSLDEENKNKLFSYIRKNHTSKW